MFPLLALAFIAFIVYETRGKSGTGKDGSGGSGPTSNGSGDTTDRSGGDVMKPVVQPHLGDGGDALKNGPLSGMKIPSFISPLLNDALINSITFDKQLSLVPDVPLGSGPRSQIRNILSLAAGWKAPWTSFPYGDPDVLASLASTADSYGAPLVAAKLRSIASNVTAANEWPGLMSVDAPEFKVALQEIAHGLIHSTRTVILSDKEDQVQAVLRRIGGYIVPSADSVNTLAFKLQGTYLDQYPQAIKELQSIANYISKGLVFEVK